MNPDPDTRHPTMAAEDFNWTCGREITAQRRRARMTKVIQDRDCGCRRRDVGTGQPRSSNQTHTFRAPKVAWCKSKQKLCI